MLVWVPFRVLICGHSSWYPASGCDLFMCSIMVDTYWYLIRILCWFQDQFESINSTAMPDGNFNYNNILDAALKVFHLLLDLHKFNALFHCVWILVLLHITTSSWHKLLCFGSSPMQQLFGRKYETEWLNNQITISFIDYFLTIGLYFSLSVVKS